MTPAHATGPRQALLPAPLLLPGLFETFTADHHRPRGWHQVPLNVRGDLRAIWVCVRAGQTDPWLAALAGWRHRATWHRRTYRSATLTPDYDDLDSWAGDRAATRQTGREIAGQYLALARHLITAGTGTGPAATTTTDRPEDASSAAPATTHLMHLGNETVTAPVLAGQRPAVDPAAGRPGQGARTVPAAVAGGVGVAWPGPWWRPGQPGTPPPSGAVGAGPAFTDRFLEFLVTGVCPRLPGVVWTYGLPGAGKTTWANGWAAGLQAAGVRAIRTGRDDVRAELAARYGWHPTATTRAQERDVTAILWARIRIVLAAGAVVFLDDLNLDRRWRDLDGKRALAAGAKILDGGWFTDVPVPVCIARDATRTDTAPVGADRIRALAARYGLPYRPGTRDPGAAGIGGPGTGAPR
jgi:predicted kinase